MQLWSISFTAEVLLQLGERQDVIDAVLARGARAQTENLSAERAALLMSVPCSCVIQLPPQLPNMFELVATWSTASYGLSQQEWNVLEASSDFKARASITPCSCMTDPAAAQAYSSWASSAIQLDRVGQSMHAPTTVAKTSAAIRRILGFGVKVLQQSAAPRLQDMLNGDLLASFTSFALDIRCAFTPQASPAACLSANREQAQQAQLNCHRRGRGAAHPAVPAEQGHQCR